MKYDFQITKRERNSQKNHSSFLILFTGLSGAGKSTLANALEKKLFELNLNTYILDGDNVRLKINKDLSFSPEDRTENIRRVGEIANLFVDAGIIVLACFISPYEKDREMTRQAVGDENFIDVFVNAPLEECERRDTKGLYKKARSGDIQFFTGISAPYQVPKAPQIEIRTDQLSIDESVDLLLEQILPKVKINE